MPSYPSTSYYPLGGGLSVEPEVANAADLATAVGGSYSVAEQLALNKFVKGAKILRVWDYLHEVYPMCGSNIDAATVKLKIGSSNVSFLVPNNKNNFTYSPTGGLQGNGTNTYIETDLTTRFLLPHAGMSFYSLAQIPSGTSRSFMGIRFDSGNFYMLGRYSSGTYDGGYFGQSNWPVQADPGANAAGLHHLRYFASGTPSIYYHRNGAQPTVTGGNVNTRSQPNPIHRTGRTFYLFADRYFDAATNYPPFAFLDVPGGYAAFDTGIPLASSLNYYKLVQQLMYDLGRVATPGNPVFTLPSITYPAGATYG